MAINSADSYAHICTSLSGLCNHSHRKICFHIHIDCPQNWILSIYYFIHWPVAGKKSSSRPEDQFFSLDARGAAEREQVLRSSESAYYACIVHVAAPPSFKLSSFISLRKRLPPLCVASRYHSKGITKSLRWEVQQHPISRSQFDDIPRNLSPCYDYHFRANLERVNCTLHFCWGFAPPEWVTVCHHVAMLWGTFVQYCTRSKFHGLHLLWF